MASRHPLVTITSSGFTNTVFPKGAVHEFLTFKQEHVAATAGFVAGILSVLMNDDGVCLWISTKRKIFPTALKSFNINPGNIVFVNVANDLGAVGAQRTSAQAADFGINAAQVFISGVGPRDRRVCGHDAGKVSRRGQFQDFIQSVKR